MRRFSLVLLLIGMITGASACNFFSQPADLQTENLQNEVARTQIAAVRETATINADRLLVTLESAETAIAGANLQSTRIAATLVAQGTLIVDTSGITPIAATGDTAVNTAPTRSNSIPLIANPLMTPGSNPVQPSGSGSAQGDSQLVPTTPTPLVQVTANPSGASLTDVTLSRQVGSDDCPTAPTTDFSTSDAEIYLTAVAHNITSSTTLRSIWYNEGAQVQDYEWSPGFSIDGACIWFLLPASEVQFVPGNWSVELTVDGSSVSAPIPFTISSSAPEEIDVGS